MYAAAPHSFADSCIIFMLFTPFMVKLYLSFSCSGDMDFSALSAPPREILLFKVMLINQSLRGLYSYSLVILF